MGEYVTDGQRLYEIVARQADVNHGLKGGVIRHATVRDCATEDERPMSALQLARCDRVRPA